MRRSLPDRIKVASLSEGRKDDAAGAAPQNATKDRPWTATHDSARKLSYIFGPELRGRAWFDRCRNTISLTGVVSAF